MLADVVFNVTMINLNISPKTLLLLMLNFFFFFFVETLAHDVRGSCLSSLRTYDMEGYLRCFIFCFHWQVVTRFLALLDLP